MNGLLGADDVGGRGEPNLPSVERRRRARHCSLKFGCLVWVMVYG